MTGLVAVYFLMCPIYDPAHCSTRDPNLYLERKMCNVRSRAFDAAHQQKGVVTIKCKGK